MIHEKHNPLVIEHDDELSDLAIACDYSLPYNYKSYNESPHKKNYFINNKDVASAIISEYYLGVKDEEYTDDEVSYVLTEFFRDYFSNYTHKNLSKKTSIRIDKNININDYQVKYESYLGDEENMYAKLSLLNYNYTIVAMIKWEFNGWRSDDEARADAPKRTFLNWRMCDDKIAYLITSLLNDAMDAQKDINMFGTNGSKRDYTEDGIKGNAKKEVIKENINHGPLYGNTFIFDDRLNKPKNIYYSQVTRRDGKVSGNLNKHANYFITNAKKGHHVEKAKQLGIKVLTEHKFRKML